MAKLGGALLQKRFDPGPQGRIAIVELDDRAQLRQRLSGQSIEIVRGGTWRVSGKSRNQMCRGRVLIVDGTRAACLALRELLEEEGYQVRCAAEWAAAKELVESFHPDVALVDENQPDALAMDGSTVTILMSVRGPSHPRRELPCLRKPIDLAELFAVVADGVERARNRGASPRDDRLAR